METEKKKSTPNSYDPILALKKKKKKLCQLENLKIKGAPEGEYQASLAAQW